MKKSATVPKTSSSKGTAIFKQMLEDKKAIHKHIKKGGKIADLKDRFNLRS